MKKLFSWLRRAKGSEARRPLKGRARPRVEQLEDRTLLSANLILLPAAELTQLQNEARTNNPQWLAFKSTLDKNLNVVISGWAGNGLTWISNYALGYQVLQNIDPTTAAEYADKAIAVLKSGLTDAYDTDGAAAARQFLTLGNGKATTFLLPNSNIVASSVQVYVSKVITVAVVHGQVNGQDPIPINATILGVSNTATGSANYIQGVDWMHNPNFPENTIDWSLGSINQPKVGATYYVTYASSYTAVATKFTLNGNKITLATAPTAKQAIFVQYVYGVHSSNGSSLAYQQTSGGGGGLNSIFDGFCPRYMYNIGLGLNWLQGYVGFSSALQTQTVNLLTQWFNYLPAAYHYQYPASNYGAGDYVFDVVTALALQGKSPNAAAMLSSVLSWRTNNFLPAIGSGGSLNGGYYPEGWNYGAAATQNLLLGSMALAEAGVISDAPEQQWANQVITALVSEQPSANTVFDGGDWYKYASPFPSGNLFSVLSSVASNSSDRAYANYILQNYPNQGSHTYLDLLFHNPTAPASYWSNLPLTNFDQGMGMLTARSDWGSTPTWLNVEMGNGSPGSAHEDIYPGQVQIQRGADDLLINANAPGGNQGNKSLYANAIIVNGKGMGSPGWYGTPGVVINAYQCTSNYTYLYGNYAAAYSTATNPGGGGPVSVLTRQVVYLNPNEVVVFDNVTTIQPNSTKVQQWNFLNAPKVTQSQHGVSFVETVNSSTLFGQTFSTAPLTATVTAVKPGGLGPAIQELGIQNASPTASVQYVTAFQISPSSTTQMVPTRQVVTTDGRMQGVQMGNQVVLFGTNGNVLLTTPVTYQVTGTGPVQQLLTNLTPGASYQVKAGGQVVTTVTASSAGTISFSTTGSQTIQVSQVILV